MSVNFNKVARVNPQKPGEAPVFDATLNSRGQHILRFPARRSADKLTLNVIDAKAVLKGLVQVMPEILSDGYTIDPEEFGNFRLTCSSARRHSRGAVSHAEIRKAVVLFSGCKLVRDAINNI